MLSKETVGNFTYDNVTVSTKLCDSRGLLNKFLNGTHMAVHRVFPYTDTSHDSANVSNTFDQFQKYALPDGMQRYEDVDLGSYDLGTVAFVQHGMILKGEAPDFSGDRVKSYLRLCNVARLLKDIEFNFHVPESHFEECAAGMDRSKLIQLCRVVRRPCVQELMYKAKCYRLDSVFAERLCMLDMQMRLIHDHDPQRSLTGGVKESSQSSWVIDQEVRQEKNKVSVGRRSMG